MLRVIRQFLATPWTNGTWTEHIRIYYISLRQTRAIVCEFYNVDQDDDVDDDDDDGDDTDGAGIANEVFAVAYTSRAVRVKVF